MTPTERYAEQTGKDKYSNIKTKEMIDILNKYRDKIRKEVEERNQKEQFKNEIEKIVAEEIEKTMKNLFK